MMVVPDLLGLDRLSRVPSLDSCVSTINNARSEATIAELKFTVQVTVTVDISLTGLGGLLVMDTETGEGTEGRKTLIDLESKYPCT